MITLKSLGGFRHGFFTRQGGVSSGIYDSLNCGPGSGDAPSNITANRSRALTRLNLSNVELLTASQVHSAIARQVNAPWQTPLKADGLATKTPGLALGVLTADCAPVLFADVKAGVIGTAHAGWQGAMSGILEATVTAMVELGAEPERIAAGIGPCIGPDSYEVGEDFIANFVKDSVENKRCFSSAPKAGHHLFDLPGYVMGRLNALNLASVESTGHDTFSDERNFFSYRRATLRGEEDYGRMLSIITLG